MFQKLKIRLIMINVILLSIVLIMIFAGMYSMINRNMEYQTSFLMNTIAEEERILPPEQQDIREAEKILSSSFFVKINTTGEIIEYSLGQLVTKEAAEDFKNLVLSKDIAKGSLESNNYKLKFLKTPKSYGFIIVFLDNSLIAGVLKWIFFASVSTGSVSLVLVFLISLYLANKALVPIKNSWEKQNAFISDASHELRTPLAVVISNLEIVMENEEETVKKQNKWLGNIESELTRMTKLVEDLLFLARSDSNVEIVMSPFNISNSISKTYEVFKPLAESKKVNLKFESKPDIVIMGNEGRIKQLLTIMLDNALKHTPNGGNIKLSLKLTENTYEITIKDNGEGIPKEHLHKIFERFYKVDKSRTRIQGGSGLGLSIAKCIVEEHRGSINVLSTVDKGTEFRMTFPMKVNFLDNKVKTKKHKIN